jgi:tRNA 2-thiouridine synthesizing protein A
VTAIDVDARGLRCPLPVIRLAEAARHAPAGSRITVLATDPAARHDIPAWCRMRDHDLLEMAEISDETDSADAGGETTAGERAAGESAAGADAAYLRFVVLVRGQPPKAAGAGSASARASRVT